MKIVDKTMDMLITLIITQHIYVLKHHIVPVNLNK